MGRRNPIVLIKRTIAKSKSVPNGMGAYPAIDVLRAFATACDVKDNIQADVLIDLLNEAEDRGAHPVPYGMELSLWVHRMVLTSFYDAKAEAEDRAERKRVKTGANSYPFVPEFQFKFRSNWLVVAEPKEQECRLSLAEHDEGYSLWIQCEERRPCIKNAIQRAMAVMDALKENHGLRVWTPAGLNYELDDHERRSILDIKSTADYYRLW